MVRDEPRRLQSRAITFLWGRREKKIPEGTWSSLALTEVFYEVSTIMYSEERKRFPQELFLPGFPTRDNLQTGTEDSSLPLTIPPPGRSGGVLIPQPNNLLCIPPFL